MHGNAKPIVRLTPEQRELVEEWNGLVFSVMKVMNIRFGGDHDDIRQDGSLGLIRAAQTYDPLAGANFQTWARTKIHSAIMDGIRSRGGGRGKNRIHPSFLKSLDAEIITGGEDNTIIYADVLADPEAAFEERLTDSAFLEELLAQIDTLNWRERAGIRAACVPGGQKRLADDLGITEAAVCLWARAARKSLRRMDISRAG